MARLCVPGASDAGEQSCSCLADPAEQSWLSAPAQGQVERVGSALPVSGLLVGGSPLQRVGKFSVTFLLTFFLKPI